MENIYYAVSLMLPFDFMNYVFMKNALTAVILLAPVIGLLGTMVINNRMAFYTDVIGHSAITGIAIGSILGLFDPLWAMIVFSIVLAVGINYFMEKTSSPSDTVIGVFFAFVVALGIVMLSKNGGFAKYTSYLIGDILSISPAQLLTLGISFVLVLFYWAFFANRLLLASINRSVAKSRGVNVFFAQTLFCVILSVIIVLSIKIVGILIINSLLVLPAAAARLVSRNFRTYTALSVVISFVSGISGLVASYYWGTATGATIVLFAAFFYLIFSFAQGRSINN